MRRREPEVLRFTPAHGGTSNVFTGSLAGSFAKPDGTKYRAPRGFRRAASYAGRPGRRGRKARARLRRIERRYVS